MFTPLAFHVTPIQPTKFHTWQWQKELRIRKNKSKNMLQLCKVDVHACLKCRPYHISFNDIMYLIQILLKIFTKQHRNKQKRITAPGRTGSIWQCNSPKLLPCPSSNKVCQSGPSPKRVLGEQIICGFFTLYWHPILIPLHKMNKDGPETCHVKCQWLEKTCRFTWSWCKLTQGHEEIPQH